MRFDAIVFDFDGVLVESVDVKTHAFGFLYAKYGKEIERRVVKYHLAHAGISRYEKFRVWQEDFLGIAYHEEDGERLSGEFSKLVFDAVVAAPFVSGALEFLQAYHQKLAMFIASGTPEEELLEIVARRKMSEYFSGVRGAPATKGAILNEVIKKGDYHPERVLMVGDAMSDFRGAQEAGAAFIGRVTHEAAAFFPSETALIADLTELPRYIEDAIRHG